MPKTGRKMYRCHELYLHTILHFPVLHGFFFLSIHIAVLATAILFNSSTWSLIMAWKVRQTSMIVDIAPAFHSSESVLFITDLNTASLDLLLLSLPTGALSLYSRRIFVCVLFFARYFPRFAPTN